MHRQMISVCWQLLSPNMIYSRDFSIRVVQIPNFRIRHILIDGKIFNDIMDVWLFQYDGEVDVGDAATGEVAQVAWMNREQIKELFEGNMFVDTLEYFFMEVDKK